MLFNWLFNGLFNPVVALLFPSLLHALGAGAAFLIFAGTTCRRSAPSTGCCRRPRAAGQGPETKGHSPRAADQGPQTKGHSPEESEQGLLRGGPARSESARSAPVSSGAEAV
ncbi:hypothetical protein [Streptomyces lydicus]|uniref:hypothetical protein n=1 Tax=Streptomyces lydicus TaxID=47763 RepID=UPI00378F59F5